jgi:hypothetical protein
MSNIATVSTTMHAGRDGSMQALKPGSLINVYMSMCMIVVALSVLPALIKEDHPSRLPYSYKQRYMQRYLQTRHIDN